MTDILVANHGSIFILTALTEAGRAWFDEYILVPGNEVQTWGAGGIVVEPRYVEAIIDGAVNDGLEVA